MIAIGTVVFVLTEIPQKLLNAPCAMYEKEPRQGKIIQPVRRKLNVQISMEPLNRLFVKYPLNLVSCFSFSGF